MKNILSLALALMTTISALAEPVSRQQAAKVAQNVLGTKDLEPVRLAPATKASDADPALYIFNSPSGGFVIVAGDDACSPVLAYSYTGTFQAAGLPENIKGWFDYVEAEVGEVRRLGLKATKKEAAAWKQALSPRTKADGQYVPAIKHETALWGQSQPFNNLAPTIGSTKAASGCGSVSMAIVLKFNGYPERGTGSLPSYSYTLASGESRTQSGHELGHTYNWSAMRMDSYSKGYTDDEAQAVAQLIYDLGVMFQAEFDKSTSTTVKDVISGLVRHMGYDAGTVSYRRGFFSDEEWTRMLKDELQHRPIVYNGHSDTGGHAFVVDGYDQAGLFSINWGWTGTDNGYFALSSFKPSGGHDYSGSQTAIFGMVPNRGGVAQQYLYMLKGKTSAGVEYCGIEADSEILAGHDFKLKIGGIGNGGTVAFSGHLVAALTDAQGRIREQVCDPISIETLAPTYWKGFQEVPCHLTLFPEEGDCLRLFYSIYGEDEEIWHPVMVDYEKGVVGEIRLHDRQSLEEVTSFSYSIQTGLAEVGTKSNVGWSVTGSDGQPVQQGVSFDTVTLTLDSAALKPDTYTVSITKGDDSVKFNVKMGGAR